MSRELTLRQALEEGIVYDLIKLLAYISLTKLLRHCLEHAGYTHLGQIAGKTRKEFVDSLRQGDLRDDNGTSRIHYLLHEMEQALEFNDLRFGMKFTKELKGLFRMPLNGRERSENYHEVAAQDYN